MNKEQHKQFKKLEYHNEDEEWMGPWREVKQGEEFDSQDIQTGTRSDIKLVPVGIANKKGRGGGS